MKSNLEDIDVKLHHQTDAAWKVSTTGNGKDAVWIPKSLCEMAHQHGTTWTLTAEQNTLEEKGLV